MTNIVLQRAKPDLPALQAQYGDAVADILGRLGAPGSNVLKITQSKTFVLPDGTESAGPLPFVIVDFIAENRFYGAAYNPNAMSPPICAALGSNPAQLAPFDDSPDLQSTVGCLTCPQNQWGSNGRGKACTNARMLALIDPMAEPGSPLLRLRLSPTAITPFEAYVRQLAKQFGKPHFAVLTYIGFDPQSTFSSLRFGTPQPLEAGELELMGRKIDGLSLITEAMDRQAEARELLMTKPDFTVTAVVTPPPRQAQAAARGGRRATA